MRSVIRSNWVSLAVSFYSITYYFLVHSYTNWMLLVNSYLLYKREKAYICIYQLNTNNNSPKMHTHLLKLSLLSTCLHSLSNLNLKRLFNPFHLCSSFLPIFCPTIFSYCTYLPQLLSLFHKVFFTLTHTHNHTQLHSDFRLYSNA